MIGDRRYLPQTAAAFDRYRAEGLHLGGQFYVSLDGRPVAHMTLGEARPGQPMAADTSMLWLSASKPVAAVALAQLWEQGRLALDDPIARHVPEFAARGKGAITLRHALTHTGGFRLLNLGWPQASWDEIIARICQARPEPRWRPGHKAGYHLASSWFLLGEVVRRLDGRPFATYVREEIFLPLGMVDCWIGMSQEHYATAGHRLAIFFDTEQPPGPAGEPIALPWHNEAYICPSNPGANGCGPMAQLGRLYEMLSGRGELGGRRLLMPQTVEALTSRHRVGMYDHTFRHRLDWGLGFILNSIHYREPEMPYGYGGHASLRAYGHSGRRSTTAFADPEHRLVVCFSVNGMPSEAAHNERTRALCEAIYQDLDLS